MKLINVTKDLHYLVIYLIERDWLTPKLRDNIELYNPTSEDIIISPIFGKCHIDMDTFENSYKNASKRLYVY